MMDTHDAQRKAFPWPGRQRFWIAMQDTVTGKVLSLGYAYQKGVFSPVPDALSIQINRHELPKAWRVFFRKQVTQSQFVVKRDADGYYHPQNPVVTLQLKDQYVNRIQYRCNDGIEHLKRELEEERHARQQKDSM